MSQPVIKQTQAWLEKIIIQLNFCPFAKKEFVNETIHYYVSSQTNFDHALEELVKQLEFLANNPSVETSLLIYPEGFADFDKYLDLLSFAEQLLADCGYEGIFQLASFHPDYCFDGEDVDDAANYTNRSPYPMLHLLREESLEKVLSVYPAPENIPNNNIKLAREKGAQYFINVLANLKN